MNDIKFENTETHEIQVIYADGSFDVVLEYENVHVPVDDLLKIIKDYEDMTDVVGVRIIRTTTNYSVIDIPFDTKGV